MTTETRGLAPRSRTLRISPIALVPVPLHRRPDPFPQADPGLVPQHLPRPGEVRVRVAHVADPRIAVLRCPVAGEQVPQQLQDAVDRDRLASRDVEGPAGRA